LLSNPWQTFLSWYVTSSVRPSVCWLSSEWLTLQCVTNLVYRVLIPSYLWF
jgi:hypothetical protein